MNRISYVMIFIIYLIMLFNITIFARNINDFKHNIIPFKTLIGYWINPSIHNTLINFIGNIVIYMPIQFLIIKIFQIKDFKKCFLIDVILVFLIETLQLVSHTGVFDIDDIILNLIGMTIMYLLTMGKHHLIFKYKEFLITSIISWIINFILFEGFSLYHFGDLPTTIVLFRLIISFIIIETTIYYIYHYLKKYKRNNDK